MRANFYFSLFYQRDMLHWDLMFIFLLFVVSAWPICLLFQSVVHFFYGESTAFDSLNNRTELYVSEGERERESLNASVDVIGPRARARDTNEYK